MQHERTRPESGFTLIELLVVMLILGVLAAIAIPAFLSQKGKANDAEMKSQVRTMQTAMETCSTENDATVTFVGCTITRLNQIEPTIPTSGPKVASIDSDRGYTITSEAASGTGNRFQITRPANAVVSHDCGKTASPATPPVLSGDGEGGCPPGGTW